MASRKAFSITVNESQHSSKAGSKNSNFNAVSTRIVITSPTEQFKHNEADQRAENNNTIQYGSENNKCKKNKTPTFAVPSGSNQLDSSIDEPTQVYKRRYFILALFCAHSAINSFQWIEYSSITNVISSYYSASNIEVNYTSLVYMLTYIPFIIHASLMLERAGLRRAVVLGTLGTAAGSFIKWWFGGESGMASFWWMMFGQTIVALSQLYVISIPPLLAAIWFPDNQVSTATGVGVFGNQLGIALGFIIPPLVISSVDADKAIIGRDLSSLACYVFWISFSICIISALFFQDKPKKPPGSASLLAAKANVSSSSQITGSTCSVELSSNTATLSSIFELCKDIDFCYLVLSYGINIGCFYAVSTILNQMVVSRWPMLIDLAGRMGLLLVISGMAGSVLCGNILDRTNAYKTIIVLIYLFSLVSMLLFTLVLQYFNSVWPLYVASAVLGFFMTGYLPLGFEYAAEITYPHPANTPAGLLNLSAQVFGLILTYISSHVVDAYGDLWANTFLTICLLVGLVLTVLMKANLKRQKAVAEQILKV